MNKNVVRGCIAVLFLLVAISVIAFAVPFEKNAVFFLSYFFALMACVVQVGVFLIAFQGGDTVMSKFYGMPIARIGVIYLIAQLVASGIFMALAAVVPFWLAVVIYVVLLCAAVIGLIAADTMRDEIVRQDVQLTKDVSCMRALQSKAAAIFSQAPDGPVREAAGKFADKLRYSDPVSSAALGEIEGELTACVDEIQKAVADGDSEGAIALLTQADALLLERNRLCKLSKSAKG